METKKNKHVHWRRHLAMYAMAFPGLLYLFCNNYMPMFGVIIAFKRLDFSKGILASEWAGLDNFKFLFQSGTAWTIIRNTLLYNIAFIILGTVFAVMLAIFMSDIAGKKISKVYQTLILLPYMISWVIVSYLVFAFLGADTGLVNKTILAALGMDSINWYGETKYWPLIITFVYLWKSLGYSMIIYYSSIVGISQDYYEAARIDGATKLQQIKSITLPLLKPTVIIMFILSVGRIFNSDFGLFYQVPKNSGLLYSVTQTIDVYVYNALMQNSDYGMSSAAGVFQSVVGFILVIVANKIIRRTNRESALF